jgi:hypothetical protein
MRPFASVGLGRERLLVGDLKRASQIVKFDWLRDEIVHARA